MIIAESILNRMCSFFLSRLTFFSSCFNRNCPSYCLLHSNGSRTTHPCSWSVDSYQKEEPRWLVGRRAPSELLVFEIKLHVKESVILFLIVQNDKCVNAKYVILKMFCN